MVISMNYPSLDEMVSMKPQIDDFIKINKLSDTYDFLDKFVETTQTEWSNGTYWIGNTRLSSTDPIPREAIESEKHRIDSGSIYENCANSIESCSIMRHIKIFNELLRLLEILSDMKELQLSYQRLNFCKSIHGRLGGETTQHLHQDLVQTIVDKITSV